VRGCSTLRRPTEGEGHGKRCDEDEEGQYHAHGSNYSDSNIPPTVAELTIGDKILPC
jgi:hypothetical protein